MAKWKIIELASLNQLCMQQSKEWIFFKKKRGKKEKGRRKKKKRKKKEREKNCMTNKIVTWAW